MFGFDRTRYLAVEGKGSFEEEQFAFALVNDYAKGVSLGIIKRIDVAERLRRLGTENEELRSRAADWERKYRDCFEHSNQLEIRLAEIDKAKDAQRQADIRDSIQKGKGTNQSEVKPDDE